MKRLLSRIGALSAAALGALALSAVAAPAAGAKITWQGIGPVKLGMSEQAMRDKLGKESSTGESDPIGATAYTYKRRKLEVIVSDGRVVAVRTTSRRERTSSRLGVGVPEKTVRRKLRGARCHRAVRAVVCTVRRGNAAMDFICRRGRVVMVTVGRVR